MRMQTISRLMVGVCPPVIARLPTSPVAAPTGRAFTSTALTFHHCVARITNWKLDFEQQEHIAGARSWMATVCQVAGEAVNLEFCGICKDTYTNWKHRPRPQCECDSEGVGACPIMCTGPTVLPALRLEHVQSKSSAQRLPGGKKLPTVKIQN